MISLKRMRKLTETLGRCGTQTERLRACFASIGRDEDTPIDFLWEIIHQDITDTRAPRLVQQQVGGVVCRVNVKLEGERIVPGVERRTYRMIATD